jgi:hypothetical protein
VLVLVALLADCFFDGAHRDDAIAGDLRVASHRE